MVTCLKEIDPIVTYAVNKPMLLSDPSRPAALKYIAKNFRLPDTLKWIAQSCLNEFQHPESRLAICSDPVSKVLAELFLEYRGTRDVTRHPGSLA
jgi:hypothetical protein